MAARLKKADDARDVQSLRKVLTFTGEKTLKDLARDCLGYRRKAGEQIERIAELVREAADGKHLHKAVFSRCVSLLEMDEGKRAIFLAHFDHYREKLGLDKIRQGSLEFPAEDKAKAPAKPAAIAKKNGKADDPPRAETLVDPKQMPTEAAVKAAADRAEERSALAPLN